MARADAVTACAGRGAVVGPRAVLCLTDTHKLCRVHSGMASHALRIALEYEILGVCDTCATGQRRHGHEHSRQPRAVKKLSEVGHGFSRPRVWAGWTASSRRRP